jgi:hypothetical protein
MPAEQPVARIQHIKPKNPQSGAAECWVKRKMNRIPARPGTLLYTCDVVAFGSNTIGAIEFTIGGRAGVNGPAAVLLEGDRRIRVVEQPALRTAWQILEAIRYPWDSLQARKWKGLEIQTNGGTTIRG